jgi:hypothetical protein
MRDTKNSFHLMFGTLGKLEVLKVQQNYMIVQNFLMLQA